MSDINLAAIQPHQVSRDLRGYSVFFYGEPKSGKTTPATKFPNHLLFAFEKGYSAIPGAMALPINSWADFRKALRQLKDEEIKKKFETIIIDTVDIAYDSIVQLDYGLVLISHSVDKTFKDEQGHEYNQIVPTLGSKPRNIVSRMCDIIGYSRAVQDEKGEVSTKLFMRGTPRYVAGSRFKYTPDYIDFSYQNLVKAIGEAIDKQAAEDGSEYFTEFIQW